MVERGIEIDKDKGKKTRTVDIWAESTEISNMKNTTNYRMTSRQICNFAFPPSILRPRAKTQRDLIVEEPNVKNVIDTVYDLDTSNEPVPEIPDDNDDVLEEEEELQEENEDTEVIKQKGGQVKMIVQLVII